MHGPPPQAAATPLTPCLHYPHTPPPPLIAAAHFNPLADGSFAVRYGGETASDADGAVRLPRRGEIVASLRRASEAPNSSEGKRAGISRKGVGSVGAGARGEIVRVARRWGGGDTFEGVDGVGVARSGGTWVTSIQPTRLHTYT